MGSLAHRVLPVIAGYGSRTAVEGDAGEVSYAELAERVTGLASGLRTGGVRRGHVVAVAASRVASLPEVTLSAWLCGAVVAITDASLPSRWVRQTHVATGARWILEAHSRQLTPVREPTHVGLPPETSLILRTSGSSGLPKHVAVSAEALWSALTWYAAAAADSLDRVAMSSRPGHDPILRDMFAPLLVGGSVVVPASAVMGTVGALSGWLDSRRISAAHLTPALVRFGRIDSKSMSRRSPLTLVIGGAELSRKMATDLMERHKNLNLFNAYGSTETPQIASWCAVEQAHLQTGTERRRSPGVSIGVGVAGRQVMLACEAGLSRGRDDEIVVVGDNLALGYLMDDLKISDAFVAREPRRCYFTGDLGGRDREGQLFWLGRVDREISVNGFRVSPEEIEGTAREHPSVTSARITCEPVSRLMTMELAGTNVDPVLLNKFLAERLPHYMLPHKYRLVKHITSKD